MLHLGAGTAYILHGAYPASDCSFFFVLFFFINGCVSRPKKGIKNKKFPQFKLLEYFENKFFIN